MENRKPQITAGQRTGIWLGFLGWVIGYALVTLPDTAKFAGPIAGAAVLSSVLAFAFERVVRRDPGMMALLGTLLTAIGLMLVYVSLVVEPSLTPYPFVVERLRELDSVTYVPVWAGVGVAIAGLAVIFATWPRHRHPQ